MISIQKASLEGGMQGASELGTFGRAEQGMGGSWSCCQWVWISANSQGFPAWVPEDGQSKYQLDTHPQDSCQAHVQDQYIPLEYSPIEEQEATLLRETERLQCQCKRLKADIRSLQWLKQCYVPYGHLLPHSCDHQQWSGKTLTDDEWWAVFHCFEMCQLEHAQWIVSTAGPILRTACYLGMFTKTVQEALSGIKTRDRRGQYIRTLSSKVFEPYILNIAKEWNLEGMPVTLKKIHKSLWDNWGGTHQIPSFEMLCQHLHKMGLGYNWTDKAKNYVDTLDIRLKQCHYLQECHSDKYNGVLFVWLDESYIHHHHVHNKV